MTEYDSLVARRQQLKLCTFQNYDALGCSSTFKNVWCTYASLSVESIRMLRESICIVGW